MLKSRFLYAGSHSPYLLALLILTTLTVGCGDMATADLTDSSRRQRSVELTEEGSLALVDKRLVPMVAKFQKRYGKPIGNIPVQIRELSDNRAGTCRLWYDGRREIIVSEQFYNDTLDDPYLLEATVFHELGHCVLNRDHDWGKTDTTDSTIYKSLMYPYVFSTSDIYEANYEYYHDELFSPESRGSLGLRLAHTHSHESGEHGFVEACEH